MYMMTMVVRYSSFLIVFVFLQNISFSKALKSSFSVEMIHRDSPKSPFYRPTETHFQRVENAILRSIHRANYFNLDSNDVEGTITPVSGEFLLNYSVGTPPVQILGIVDTGASFIWMQCQPCENCYKQDRPIFDPSTSRTYSSIPCVAAECLSGPNSFCNFNNRKHCAYKATYGDGSFSEGDFSWDTITLTSSTKNVPVAFPQTVIGCGHNNVGIFGKQSSGIVGIGNGPLSLANQLKPKTGGTFSYCLTPMYEGDAKPSYLHFGDLGEVVEGAVSTPLIINKVRPSMYFVVMEAISVGSKRIEFPGNVEYGNIFIDSGATMTYLPDEVYSSLEREMVNAVNLPRTNSPLKGLKLCYEITAGEEYHIPTVFAHFKGGGAVKLYSINTFLKVRETVICLAFRSGFQAIFGNLAQQDILVSYDTQQNTVTFLNTDCTSEL
ncbi:aspartic proteinase CDR1-like [Vigna angularis]|uniref:aspartic proteinase CDR1-like n=1 Tax=Phaseolus angularis TaxID=3914 RepID=UPI0022B2B6A9|nr:aspartic proteinase CDR1-like [Vigna angularis]